MEREEHEAARDQTPEQRTRQEMARRQLLIRGAAAATGAALGIFAMPSIQPLDVYAGPLLVSGAE